MAIPQAGLRSLTWRSLRLGCAGEGEREGHCSRTLGTTPRAMCTCQMGCLACSWLPGRLAGARGVRCRRAQPQPARGAAQGLRGPRARPRAGRPGAPLGALPHACTHAATHARTAKHARQTHAKRTHAACLHLRCTHFMHAARKHARQRTHARLLRWQHASAVAPVAPWRRGWCCGCATTRSPTCASTRRARCCRWASSSPTTGSSPRRPPSSRGCRCFFPSLQALL